MAAELVLGHTTSKPFRKIQTQCINVFFKICGNTMKYRNKTNEFLLFSDIRRRLCLFASYWKDTQ